MLCENVSCKYYRPPEKRDWFEKQIGVSKKHGGCKHPYCRLRSKNNKYLKK